jgi:fibronectin-binding autotransporter adhesin
MGRLDVSKHFSGALRRRFIVVAPIGLALSIVGVSAGSASAACTLSSPVSWTGASGAWTTGSNWSGGTYPNSAATNACITTSASDTITLGSNATVGNLQTGPADTLTIGPGGHLTVAGTQYVGSGNLKISAGGGQDAILSISNNVMLSGHVLSTGVLPTTITLSSGSGGGTAYIRGAGHTLTSYDNVIQGAGVIGDDGMNFVNGIPGNVNSFAELLVNTPGGVMDVNSGGGSFKNGGFVEVFQGSTLKVTADSNGYDQIGGYTEVDGLLIAPNGVDNAFTTSGRSNGQGELSGIGTIVGNVYNDGIIAPGGPYVTGSVLTITGNLTLGRNSNLAVVLNGVSPGQFSQLAISGAASLSGDIDINGYTPGPNSVDAYQIMDFASSTGDFGGINFLGNPCTASGADLWLCAKGLYFEEKFDSAGLELIALGAPEPSTWALLTVGLGGLGAILRRRRRIAFAL